MRHSPSRLLLIGFMALFLLTMMGSITTTDAQTYPNDFINDGTLFVYVSLDGINLKEKSLEDPLAINMEAPMDLFLQLNASGSQTLNVSGTITFWYQAIALFPIHIVDASNNTWFTVDPSSPIPPVLAPLNFAGDLSYGPIDLTTGVFEATIDFRYYAEGNSTQNHLFHRFSFIFPSTPLDIITSVTGIVTVGATAGVAVGLVGGINSLIDGLKTAYKLRGIHKKASEIRSLPNLTVLGALPLLFSIVDSMKDKKKEGREDSGVSEYIVRQRLREVAPDAWQIDKCPQCKRKWNKKLDMCKKCNFTQEDARIAYADLLSTKVPAALKWMGKKKSTDVKTLAKKTKSTQYNAGVIAAAMVDTNVTEITKVGTPLRSFVMNIAGLAFVVVTWQQLLGDSASNYQTTLTVVGAALSLAVIVALYVSRKAQIEKFTADQEAGKKILPTEEEASVEAGVETEETPESEDVSEGLQESEDETVEPPVVEDEVDTEPEPTEDELSEEEE